VNRYPLPVPAQRIPRSGAGHAGRIPVRAAVLISLFLASFCAASALEEWDWFEKSIRDGIISRKDAIGYFQTVHGHLGLYCTNILFNPDRGWVFPVEGYSSQAIGRDGFEKGFYMFEKRKRAGHSAYDIFIYDRDQDCLDDTTGRPVRVLAPVDLLVISTFTNWRKGSWLNGGNYVWAYDPLKDRLFYFAHLSAVGVKKGDLLRAGDSLGLVGRTGKNARPKRSDTHLHLMVLKIDGTRVTAVDYYREFFTTQTLVR
jgi:hypothetical protein